jgi:molybdate transport system substrate-binding protein
VIRRAAAGATVGLLLLFGGCGSAPASSGSPGSTSGQRSVTVFAAASLKQPFTALGARFESSHPGTSVSFSFAGSSDLVTQLQEGAPADVFASADTTNMAKATADDLVDGTPVLFASNTLEIAVPPDNPARIGSLRDLAGAGVTVVVCAPAVPCGSATRKVEAATGITLHPVSEESAVTDVLNKVQTGEADAGLVYVTDVHGAGGKVAGITFAESASAVNDYPIARLRSSKEAGLAGEFTELVTGPEGQRVLADAGFAKPRLR